LVRSWPTIQGKYVPLGEGLVCELVPTVVPFLFGVGRFFTKSISPRSSALTLAMEYLDLVDACAEADVPLGAVKRHLRDFVEADIGW
jgi:hypothetical protein